MDQKGQVGTPVGIRMSSSSKALGSSITANYFRVDFKTIRSGEASGRTFKRQYSNHHDVVAMPQHGKFQHLQREMLTVV